MGKQRPTFVRFLDLTEADLNVEYQTHTTQTDGQASIEDILGIAHERQLATLAFTEHVRKDTDWFEQFVQDVRDAAHHYPDLHVLVGCEAKALDTEGTIDLSQHILEHADIVLGSVHRFPNSDGGYVDFSSLEPRVLAEIECQLSLGMLRYAPIDVLAHPGGMYQRRYGTFPEDLFREMLEVSLERAIAVEISSSYLADVDGFLRLCGEINPYVSIGSDVHKLDEVGRCRDMLRALGVGKR